jgi:predicted phosphate transport protein (TIGR00153 family)
MQEHIEIVTQCVEELEGFITASADNDWDTAIKCRERIIELEGQADEFKKQIRKHLPQGLFMPVPRTDLLELLQRQDKIANRAKDVSGIMLGRKMVIPAQLKDEFIAYVQGNIEAVRRVSKAVHELDELVETSFSGPEAKFVQKLLTQLEESEENCDALQIKLRESLFNLEDELPPVHVMFLYKIIDWVGDISDRAQRTGAGFQQLLAK